jgi:hypothetical protein
MYVKNKLVISFSLYGTEKKYILGSIENVKIAKKIYPEWEVHFYVSRKIPTDILNKLKLLGAKIIIMPYSEGHTSTLWRLRAFLEPENDIVIIRDCDSRLSKRERLAVYEWLNSGRVIHIMRDHPLHNAFIMAGMWGGKVKEVSNELSFLKKPEVYKNRNKNYGYDQELLKKVIYSRFKYNAFIHDEYTSLSSNSKSFPIQMIDDSFVGQVIENNNMPNHIHQKILKDYKKSLVKKLRLNFSTFVKRILNYFS